MDAGGELASRTANMNMATTKFHFGKLRIKIPQNINTGSHKKIEWVCDCGRETTAQIHNVVSGHTNSCGRCNEILADEISKRKFGKLRIKTPQDILPGSGKKIKWICDCGKEANARISYVLNGTTSSCGECNIIISDKISQMKFGKLRIKKPQNIKPGSGKKIGWMCDCGKLKSITARDVISGRTRSCGNCHGTILNWFLSNKEKIQSLKCPINPKDVPHGGVTPLEPITKSHTRFQATCPACKNQWSAYWHDIKRGVALTCGCSYNKTSLVQNHIFELIKVYDPNAQLEYKLGTFYYDIFVPSKKLLIEYDGEIWHKNNKAHDLKKHKLALDHGYQFMRILEKDWKDNRHQVIDRLIGSIC